MGQTRWCLAIVAIAVANATAPGKKAVCHAGTFGGVSFSFHKRGCFRCPSNKFGQLKTTTTGGQVAVCLKCPGGKYTSQYGKTSCAKCSLWEDSLGIDQCSLDCLPGKYRKWAESSLGTSCVQCAKGRFMPNKG